MDADTQQNGPPFSFEIPRGNEGQEFLIDQDGTLKTDVKFTSKSKRVYVLQVRVYDNGTPTLFSDTWVTVRVIEESRYPPVVKALEVNVNSYNNEFPGGIIGRVRATDQDPYDNVLFSIVSKHRYILDINSEDGSLTALPGLIAGIYHVNVSASDGKFTSYGEVKIIVKQITDEMQYNAIVMRFKDVTPEEFVVDHQKSFIRAIKNLQSVNVKDVDILSMQPASQESTRMKRDSKQDLDVMFTVCRSKSRMISSDTLLKAVTDQKSKIEAVIGLKV